MSFIIFLIVGLIAGALAKAIMPGSSNEPGGWLMTMVLGVVGAFVGGFLGNLLFGAGAASGSFSLPGILMATVGAIVVIGIMRLVTGNKRAI
ncbi:MAG: GlsB/YeaQ/YmgE family stress response membrane protein [Akkermansiaceae bacterium]|nr:GlsB/YeaQ/YmgE family stress response membrane protein [Armatimonadota bacterium]